MRQKTIGGLATLLVLILTAPLPAQVESMATAPYENFESGPVRQLLLSPDGSRLYLLHTQDHRLEVYRTGAPGVGDLTGPAARLRPERPLLTHEASIFTGLDPVSMALDPTDANRMFVANLVSDSISVVDLAGHVIEAVIPAGDEPQDVLVLEDRLYVACARARSIADPSVFVDHALVICSANAPYERLAVVGVEGHKPRALATDGRHVYIVPQNSGNHTTMLKDDLAQSLGITQLTLDAFDTNFILNEALAKNFPWWVERGWEIPPTGRVVFDWEFPNQVPQLPDRDVIAYDTKDDALEAAFTSWVGTTLFAIERNPVTGDLWVANTDANNRTRMEYNLTGKAVRNLVTIVESEPGGDIQDYVALRPPLTSMNHSQPHAIAFHTGPAGNLAYVAALGTATVVVLDAATGELVTEIRTGDLPGGLAIDRARERLYVYSRGDKAIRAYDIAHGHAPLGRSTAVPYDPEPPLAAAGRRMLYDASPSSGAGNGNMACATCHVFGDTDGMAWDLGNSQGALAYAFPDLLGQPESGFLGRKVAAKTTPVQNPMKGPLTTQSLRGIADDEPLHWRGDRRFLHHFQGAFVGLQGGTGISEAQMQEFAGFVRTLIYPPNPYQSKDREYTGDAAAGLELYGMPPFAGVEYVSVAPGFKCVTCHVADFQGGNFKGTDPFLNEEAIFQVFNPATFRGIYNKEYRELTGFGTHHDGAFDGSFGFLDHDFQGFPSNDLLNEQEKRQVAALLQSWDSGISPLLGDQFHLDASSAGDAAAFLDLAELQAQPPKGWIDLIAKGWRRDKSGARVPLGLLFRLDSGSGTWRYQSDAGVHVNRTDLIAQAEAGNAALTFTAVLPGTGRRLGIDRDEDGLLDRIEIAVHGTRPDDPDTDDDGYDDAADLALGGNPAVPDASLPDAVAPTVLSVDLRDPFVSSATLIVVTDEPSTLTVTLQPTGGAPTPAPRQSPSLRRRHELVLSDLTAATTYQVSVTARDKNGNAGQGQGSLTTVVPHLHVESIELNALQTDPLSLEAKFRIVDRSGQPVSGVPVQGRLAGDFGPNAEEFTVTTNSAGVATRVLTPYTPQGSGSVTVTLDYLGTLNESHPYFVGRGGSPIGWYYEQSANEQNFATYDIP